MRLSEPGYRYSAGLNITIQDSEPPTSEVMEAFKAVETAKQGKETALNNANKYRNEQLPLAQAQADGIIKDAEAQKTERINEATAQVARFNASTRNISRTRRHQTAYVLRDHGRSPAGSQGSHRKPQRQYTDLLPFGIFHRYDNRFFHGKQYL